MFNVIKAWANWDAIREEIIATVDTREEAEAIAKSRRTHGSSSAYIVRPTSEGFLSYESLGPVTR